ncbi:MAG: hypothetical protein N3E38_01125 [Candidatus Aenigmarchaeota archaeon]|nr:hypothetical protein [Candidatus Aenigmarchaeota archaeon]
MPFKNSYVRKVIGEVNADIDLKIKVMGFVVDKSDVFIVVDDGKNKIKIFVEPEMMEKIDIHQFIAVYGTTIPTEDGFEIKADAIQDLTGLNLQFYKKMNELYKKWGC